MGRVLTLKEAAKLNAGSLISFRRKEDNKYTRHDALVLRKLTDTDDFRVITEADYSPVFVKRSQIVCVYELNIWALNHHWNTIAVRMS